MEFVQTLLLGFAALCAGCVLAALRHSKRPLSRAAQSAFGGIAALAAVDVLAGYTGVALALNYATACGAGGAGGGDAAAFARRAGAVSRKKCRPGTRSLQAGMRPAAERACAGKRYML